MKNLIIILVAINTILSGCVFSQHEYRDITQNELEKYTYENYSIDSLKGILNLDEDDDKEVLLTLEPEEQEGVSFLELPPAIVIALDFNKRKDGWEQIDRIELEGVNQINFNYSVDTDSNGINEVLLEFITFGTSGSGRKTALITIENEKLVDLLPPDVRNEKRSGSPFLDGKNIYLGVFIWGRDEGHFGCHYFKIKKYSLKKDRFALESEYRTANKYNFEGDKKECEGYPGVEIMMRKEGIKIESHSEIQE